MKDGVCTTEPVREAGEIFHLAIRRRRMKKRWYANEAKEAEQAITREGGKKSKRVTVRLKRVTWPKRVKLG